MRRFVNSVLSDPEILDLTLAVSLFSALALIEPLIMAPTMASIIQGDISEVAR
jgi:hypothetical protein